MSSATLAPAPAPAQSLKPTPAPAPDTAQQGNPSLSTSSGAPAPSTSSLPGANSSLFPSNHPSANPRQDYAKNVIDSARIESELLGNKDAYIIAAKELTSSGYKKAEVIGALQAVMPFDEKNPDVKATYAAVFNAVAAIEKQQAASSGTTLTLRREKVLSPEELSQEEAKARKAHAGADVAVARAGVEQSRAELDKKKIEQAQSAQGTYGQEEADTKVQAKTAGNKAEIANKDRRANKDEKGQGVDNTKADRDEAKNERQESKERVGWWKDKWDTAVDVLEDIEKIRKK
jgi:hypothetical protein